MSEKRLREDLAAMEAALASLSPTPCGVDRDRMMFQAGRASAEKSRSADRSRRSSWLWPSSTAASVLLAVVFASMWLTRGGQEVRIVYFPAPTDAGEPSYGTGVPFAPSIDRPLEREKARMHYLELRRLVITQGVDAVPQPAAVPWSGPEPSSWRCGDRKALEELVES